MVYTSLCLLIYEPWTITFFFRVFISSLSFFFSMVGKEALVYTNHRPAGYYIQGSLFRTSYEGGGLKYEFLFLFPFFHFFHFFFLFFLDVELH